MDEDHDTLVGLGSYPMQGGALNLEVLLDDLWLVLERSHKLQIHGAGTW